jgi:hypothetical protein
VTHHVTTFYSFKGGVGRSLLLANVGWQLAERRKVLLWDLDLEAPGLHRIPALRPTEVETGFLDWLGGIAAPESLLDGGALTKRAARALRKLVQPVPKRPNLSILPAFGDNADFARLYSEGPWRRLLVEEPDLGLALFDALVAVLGEERDHLLLDSRTGITDIGGFLTALLPHATVLVGGYGHQNLYGLRHVHQALETAGREPLRARLDPGADLQLIPVVSPVPEADDIEISAERRRVWREVFGETRPLEVPFVRRLLWNEELLVETDPESPAAGAYRQLAQRLDALQAQLSAQAEEARETGSAYPDLESPPNLIREPGQRRGFTFEERTRRLLQLHGYEVESEQLLGGHKVDLVARRSGGLSEECWWVECKDHRKPVGKGVLETLAAWIGGDVGRSQRASGMVVARAFTPAARGFATDHPALRCWTIDDLEQRLFDPRPYLQALVAAFESSPLGRTYVEQRVLLEGRRDDDSEVDLLPHALSWAGGDGHRLWLLLGDYGTGKSAFFQRFAYELARRALDDPEAPFPIAIDLRLTANATSLEGLLFEHMREQARGELRATPAVLLHLLSAGRCVLLLDSFDEMGVAAVGRGVEEQFRELARLAGEEPLEPRRGNRLLITCRTHFFRDQQQVKDTAEGRPAGLRAAEDSALGRLARRFSATIDELCLFDDAQIRQFLENHLGARDAERAAELIQKTYDLPRLAPRPVLLEMITRSLPDLWQSGGKITPAGLYEVYTRQWLEDRSGRNLQTRPLLRHRLLALLASCLWRRDDRRIHHADLLAEVRALSRYFPGLDYDRVDLELRSAAFLVRSPDGLYRFSHKSFLEYFLASGLVAALAVGEGTSDADEEASHLSESTTADPEPARIETMAAALDLPPLSPEVGVFFWQLGLEEGRKAADGPCTEIRQRLEALAAILQAPYRSRASENALRLVAWYGHPEVGGAEPYEVAGAHLEGAHLTGASLAGVRLPGAHLHRVELDRADLAHAQLTGARLDHASLREVVLAGADLTGATLHGSDLTAADLEATVLHQASLEKAWLAGAFLDRADLRFASLAAVDLADTSFDRVDLRGADLSEARLKRSVWTSCTTKPTLTEPCDSGMLRAPGGSPPRHAPLVDPIVRVTYQKIYSGVARSVAYSPDGSQLACGSSDGTVRVWSLTGSESPRELGGAGGWIYSVAYSPDGSQLACGSDDGTVRVWSREGRLLVELSAEDDLPLITLPEGWCLHFPRSVPLDSKRFRLQLSPRWDGPYRDWHSWPLAGLGRWLERPDYVAAALASEEVPVVRLGELLQQPDPGGPTSEPSGS